MIPLLLSLDSSTERPVRVLSVHENTRPVSLQAVLVIMEVVTLFFIITCDAPCVTVNSLVDLAYALPCLPQGSVGADDGTMMK